MNAKCFLFISIGLAATLCSRAQTLDPTFGNGGIVETYYGLYVDSKVNDMLLQPDGKIIVCGTTYVNSYDFMLIRYLEDGSLDPAFGDNGKAFIDFDNINNYGLGFALQSDGKIVIAGWSETPGYNSISLARINSDGTADTAFGENGIVHQSTGDFDSKGYDVIVQTDNKILVAGIGNYLPQGEDFFIARYNEDGSLDASFDGDGKVENINDLSSGGGPVLTLQSDGKILLAGMGGVAGQQHYCTMRLNADGSLDPTYSDDGIQLTLIPGDYNWPGNIVVQEDGMIVVAGYSGYWQSEVFSLFRLDANGNPDLDFATNGVFTHSINPGLDLFQDVLIQPDGKILACGYTIVPNEGYDFIAMRLLSDGSIDTDFGEGGVLNQTFSYTESRATAMAIQPDGKLLIAGDAPDFLNHHTAVARYDAGIPALVESTGMLENSVQLMPNPASDYVKIHLENDETISTCSIRDTQGRLLLQETPGAMSHSMNLDKLSAGVYFLSATDSKGVCYVGSLIKE